MLQGVSKVQPRAQKKEQKLEDREWEGKVKPTHRVHVKEGYEAILLDKIVDIQKDQKTILGQQRLEAGQQRLEDGQKRLEDGQKRLEDGQKRLEDGQQQTNLLLSEILAELRKGSKYLSNNSSLMLYK